MILSPGGGGERGGSEEEEWEDADATSQQDELLALASIYDSGILSVLDGPGELRGGLFKAHLDLPHPFHVDISMFDKSLTAGVTTTTTTTTTTQGCFQNSLMEVKHLPPIELHFSFPADYPSASPPLFTICCTWLDRPQISKLCKELDRIWVSNQCEIIFSWVQFLKEDTLDFLGIKSPITLTVSSNNNAAGRSNNSSSDHTMAGDSRAVQDVSSSALLLALIKENDNCQRQLVFDKSHFTCDVCFDEKLGGACMNFYGCDHVYCRDCMKEYFTIQITDGSVKALQCPYAKCLSQAQPSQVRELVGEDLYSRYDRLLLQTSLDTMSDVVYCPRLTCQSAVLLESDTNMGICAVCSYPFCAFCRMAYHGVSPCRLKPDECKKIKKEYQNADSEGKRLMERRYGRRAIINMIMDEYTEQWLNENSKQCPQCGIYIHKSEGCNRMVCFKCRVAFCWLCLSTLSQVNPYSHFNQLDSQCFNKLFLGVDVWEDEEGNG